jgi:hypothetical protein
MSTITAEVVDTGEKRDARGRRVTPGARRRQLVQAYRGGGLTMADFARREGINYSTFAGWVAKSAREPAPRAPVRFAEVALPWGPRKLVRWRCGCPIALCCGAPGWRSWRYTASIVALTMLIAERSAFSRK